MKKLAISLSILLSAANAFGYTHKVRNTTSGSVRVEIDIIAGYNKHVELKPGETKSVGVGAYCMRGAEGSGRSGDVEGLRARGENTGISCRGTEIFVKHVGRKWTYLEGGIEKLIDRGKLVVEVR